MTAKKWLLGLLLLFGTWLTPYQGEQARATTMTAQVCTVATFGCPLGNTLDAGIRTNGVGILGFNRYAVLPFVFSDAAVRLTGTVVVADILFRGSNFIYLYGQGIGTQSILGGAFFLNSIISQTYRTLGGLGTFGAFNIGGCNLAGIAAGDGSVMQPIVNLTALAGVGTTACSPFAQTYPAQNVLTGALTTLTAAEDMQFNLFPGGGAQITLPWGDDLPDPSASGLNSAIDGDSLPTVISDLQALGLTQQAPEPTTLALFGSGLLGLGALRRRRRASK